jgi:hypothetical protein
MKFDLLVESLLNNSSLDEEYFKTINEKDVKKLQQLVFQQARIKNEYNKPWKGVLYRGGVNNHHVIKSKRGVDIFLTYDENIAKQYADVKSKENGKSPIIKRYMYKGLIFDPSNPHDLKKIKNHIRTDTVVGIIKIKDLEKRNYQVYENPSYQKILKDLGYDGYMDKDDEIDSNIDDLSDEDVLSATSNIAIFDIKNVKLADPITYDDQNQIIPLSQRFDTSKKDTRY